MGKYLTKFEYISMSPPLDRTVVKSWTKFFKLFECNLNNSKNPTVFYRVSDTFGRTKFCFGIVIKTYITVTDHP